MIRLTPIALVSIALLPLSLLAGCGTPGERGYDRSSGGLAGVAGARAERDWRPRVHEVQKGDTLYSIALNYGFDYHELAELNGIDDPSKISIGQKIHLFRPKSGFAAANSSVPANALIKDQPRVVKFAYSPAAMAKIDSVQSTPYVPEEPPKAASSAVEPSRVVIGTVSKPAVETSHIGKPAAETAEDEAPEVPVEPSVEWIMPTKGKIIAGFSESANRKGIDIAGSQGQPIFASATGKVVYSGSGLRGYGKLIIIKHNQTFLSAYAHNDSLLVKDGDNVTRGQKIATMGQTDTDQVKLHFEVRRFGKPVDPAKYLPVGKS